MPPRALEGLRVLDVTQFVAGPFCAVMLADLGADVIKVESPAGESTRRMVGAVGTESPAFNAVNRGKRSLVLNLKSIAGQRAFARMARSTDIVVENYRPGVMRSFGLDYPALAAGNPRIDLRVDLRLRTDRPRSPERRLRSDRAGGLRHHVDDRGARRRAGESGSAGHRSRRRPVCADRHSRRAAVPSSHRTRATDRHVVDRGRRRAVGLGSDGILRRPRCAAADGVGPPDDRAVSGHPVRRRIRHDWRQHRSSVPASR